MHEGLATEIFEGPSRDGGHLGDQTVGRDHPLLGIIHIGAVMIKGRQSANGTHHDRHGVGVAAEAHKEPIKLLVEHGVIGDGVFELFEFLSARKFAVQKQVADLQKAGALCKLINRIAAVQQNALIAIDKGDLAFAGGRRGEARIVGENVCFRI